MTEPQKPTSWWQTLPGLLTALAAVLTAGSGLLALLFQNGVLGSKTEKSAQVLSSPPQQAPPAARPKQTLPASPGSSATARIWSDATAVVVDRAGATTRLRADSFSNCISVNHEIAFTSGQSIAFEKMSGFEVVQADDHTSPNPKAKLDVKLLDGTVVSGTVEANCDLFGYSDLGRFTTYFDRIRSVRFE